MTDLSHLETVIEAAWENRAEVSTATHGEVRDAVETALELLDSGQARVASRGDDGVWTTHQWLKKAVLLSFRLNDNQAMAGGAWDKVPLKTAGWDEARFRDAGFRAVPGAVVRPDARGRDGRLRGGPAPRVPRGR